MALQTAFEQKCVAIGNTELWKLLKEKTEKQNLAAAFLEAVGQVCFHGIMLAKDIIRFFPTFTLHDETHIANVCNWMVKLIGEGKEDITVYLGFRMSCF